MAEAVTKHDRDAATSPENPADRCDRRQTASRKNRCAKDACRAVLERKPP
jgi:hypothetical protein